MNSSHLNVNPKNFISFEEKVKNDIDRSDLKEMIYILRKNGFKVEKKHKRKRY